MRPGHCLEHLENKAGALADPSDTMMGNNSSSSMAQGWEAWAECRGGEEEGFVVTERPGGCRGRGVELTLEVGAWDGISHTVQPNTGPLELLKVELNVPTTWKMLHSY